MSDFPQLNKRVLIAMNGPPCTGKADIADAMGEWSGCRMYHIDDFLYTLYSEKGYISYRQPSYLTINDPNPSADHINEWPSPDEADRLHRLALDGLCKATTHHRSWRNECIIVNSRLCSALEVDRLVDHAGENGCGLVLIVECQIGNKYRFKHRLDDEAESCKWKGWYNARSWKYKGKVGDDSVNAKADSSDPFHNQIDRHYYGPRVVRLVLDPIDSIGYIPTTSLSLTSSFKEVINYLLPTGDDKIAEEDWDREILWQSGKYVLVKFGELRQYLLEKELRNAASRERSTHFCTRHMGGNCCVFKYVEQLQCDDNCGLCEGRVVIGEPAYTCHFCILTLHKSCAELPGASYNGLPSFDFSIAFFPCLPYTCKDCSKQGKDFSSDCMGCLLQTHLKWCELPTIFHNDCHQHFLSVSFEINHTCKGCGTFLMQDASYGCYTCGSYYCMKCLFLRGEVKYEHVEHERAHALKLAYSSDGMDREEVLRCDICSKEMDPQLWFYSCQECPRYAAHPECISESVWERRARCDFKSDGPALYKLTITVPDLVSTSSSSTVP